MSGNDPHAAPGPFRVGDRVRIHPDWQDPGDDDFVRVVIEAPADSPRVRVATLIPGFDHPPAEWIEVDRLLRLTGRLAAWWGGPLTPSRQRPSVGLPF